MDDEQLRRWALELAISTFGQPPAPVDLVSAAAAFAGFIRPAAPLLSRAAKKAARASLPKSPDAALISAKGGSSAVARGVGVTVSYVSAWTRKGIPSSWRPRVDALPDRAPFDRRTQIVRLVSAHDAQWSPARLAKLQEMLAADRPWDDITTALNLLPGTRIDSIAAAQLIASSHRFRRPTKPHRPAAAVDVGLVEHTAHA